MSPAVEPLVIGLAAIFLGMVATLAVSVLTWRLVRRSERRRRELVDQLKRRPPGRPEDRS